MNAILPGKRLDPLAITIPEPEPATLSPKAPVLGRKLNFGDIKKAATVAGKTKTQYPVYPPKEDEKAQLEQTVDYLIDNIPVVDAVDTAKKQITTLVTPFYFNHATGRNEVESSVAVVGTKGELLVMFPKQLVGSVPEADIAPILGVRVNQFFRSTFEIKINGDQVPAHHAQSLIDEMMAVFAKYDATDALSVKEKYLPNPEFFLRRHLDLTPEENLALNEKARVKTSIKIRK